MPETGVHCVSRALMLHVLRGATATTCSLLAGPPLIRAGYLP